MVTGPALQPRTRPSWAALSSGAREGSMVSTGRRVRPGPRVHLQSTCAVGRPSGSAGWDRAAFLIPKAPARTIRPEHTINPEQQLFSRAHMPPGRQTEICARRKMCLPGSNRIGISIRDREAGRWPALSSAAFLGPQRSQKTRPPMPPDISFAR